MTTGFTKLFGDILYSSIWQEDNETRLVWVTLLAMTDREGLVKAAMPGIAHAARVSLEATEAAMEKFQAPDPMSRSQDYEGRRVERVDGGWRLLNYQKYRGTLSEVERREYKRVKQAEYRRAERERPAREAKKKALLKAPGTLAERLALQAEKEGDGEMLARLSEIDRAKQAQNEAFQRKMAETIAAVQSDSDEKESLSGEEGGGGVPPEGVDGEKFPEV